MKNRWKLIPSLLLLGPVVAAAQVPRPPEPGPDLGAWWKNSEIVRELGLTGEQVRRIEQIFLEHRLKLIDLQAQVAREEVQLQPLIEADQVDEPKVLAQVDRLLSARMQLEKTNIRMMLSIRQVLTTEQWRKLEAIKQERQRRFAPAPPPPGAPPRPPEQVPPPQA